MVDDVVARVFHGKPHRHPNTVVVLQDEERLPHSTIVPPIHAWHVDETLVAVIVTETQSRLSPAATCSWNCVRMREPITRPVAPDKWPSDSGHEDEKTVWLDDSRIRDGLADLRWRLDDLLAGGSSRLIIDVSGVGLLSSATMAAMLWTKRRCMTRGVQMVVRNPTRQSLSVLRRSGLLVALCVENDECTSLPTPE